MKPNVSFLRVTDNKTKLQRILNTVQQHFFSGNRMLIYVSNKHAADYLDQLLWKSPPESYLPHAQSDTETAERIVITEGTRNINQANVALNLTQGRCPDYSTFETIYELLDETDPKRQEQSAAKQRLYQ